MKMVIRIFLGVVIIVAIPLVLAIFTKKNYHVEKMITINRPRSMVFDYVRLLKNQDNYSVWATIDPGMKKYFRGTDGNPGFISGWESTNKKVGKGEQEIKRVTAPEKIDYEIRFLEPFAGIAQASMITDSVSGNETEVSWQFDSRMNYPMNIMLLFMNMDKMVGNDLEKGLTNLKQVLEQ
jgi:hypothetical protein